jgi:3'-phosphoadenosine 5'-phosphosulfate (PAPS) 3'-phosphatase
MLTERDLKSLSEIACDTAIAAGVYIQTQFNQQNETMHKAGGNSLASQVVTAVDFKAQEIILQGLEGSITQYDLGLLTEEASDDQSRHEKTYFWCIDPMDGTLAFTEGRTGYAVSIALVNQAGDPIIGVVYVPDQQKCYTAIKGAGIFLNGQSFDRKDVIRNSENHSLKIYLDISLQKATYYEWLKQQLQEWAVQKNHQVKFHIGFGAVRNAVGVMFSPVGAYFKFPKKAIGGGSIWDYAATRLFFEELGLSVSNSVGEPLHLNKPNTFMHEVGTLYATEPELAYFIVGMGHKATAR